MTCARGTQAVSFALFTSRKKREEALRKSSGARERRQNLDTSIGWLLLLQVVLIALNAVFACAEIAVLSVNEVKLSKMVSEGSRKAKRLSRLTAQPARFLATIQVAITLAGFLGSAFAAENFSDPLVDWLVGLGVTIPPATLNTLAVILITLILSFFTLVFGELVPKRIAMQRTEQIARAVVPAIDAFAAVCRPIIWLIGKNTNGIVRLLGFDPNETDSEVSDDELRVLVNTNTNLSKDERTILDDVFDASETIVAEVMRPRADVAFLDGSMPIAEAAAYVREMPYSRYPVTGKDFDDVLGFVHVRDLLDIRDPKARTVADVTREGISLPGTSKLLPSLELLRKRGIHLAVVIDEYGGTDGIVTLEDMTEELVGDIRDEYDLPEEKGGERTERAAFVNGVATIEGGMTIEDFADLTGIELEDGPYETVAGYFLAHTGKMGEVGDVLSSDDGYDMVVTEVDGRRIETLEVRRHTADEDGSAAGDSAADAK